MCEQPTVEHRAAQAYAAIPLTITMRALAGAIDRGFPELFDWLASRSIDAVGPPFVRYLHIDMEGSLEVELAVPTEAGLSGGAGVRMGTLPAGRYATLLHVGPYDGLIAANAALQAWGRERGIAWQMDPGARWSGRVERYLTDPSERPDAWTWQTELAYLIADDRDARPTGP
jgi:effector-binding domain-containing protein